ncbi:alpha/beta hydrolase family protein [Kineococcus arenarius]|uniref:hypothetical protein n=1 Tax=unclassified Kineococcus TaxID=2621656 RepID=UPI003D7DB0A1
MKIFRAAAVALAAAALTLPAGAATAASTGGTGGPLTDRLDVPFSSGGLTSDYHVFAKGLDWSKSVGLLVYGDGSGGYGLDNPNASHLLDADGRTGLVAVAKKHNLLLVVPEAPGPGCNGYDNCWFDSTAPQKAAWSNALVDQVKSQYAIDTDRIVIGGYSSGAQWATRWFLPTYGEAQSVDLAIAIAYGGAPAVAGKFSSAYKASTTVSFDTGTADQAYSTSSAGALGGHKWYTAAGFTTDATWPAGVGHSRSGQFAAIVDREVSQHLRPAAALPPAPVPVSAPVPTPVPTTPTTQVTANPRVVSSTAYATKVAPTATGVTFTVQVPENATAPTYVRLSGPRSTYLYTSAKPSAQLTFKTLGTDGAKWNYTVHVGSSTSAAPVASGTFSTVVR